MLWILLALGAHAGNALVFVVDKSLLNKGDSKLGRPLNYTFYSAVLAGAAIIILPFSYSPITSFVLQWGMLAGLLHIVALWFFFNALKAGESTRVVPIAGSAVPLFTLVFGVTFLGEIFVAKQLVAVALLIIGGAALSISVSGVKGLRGKAMIWALISGLFFAGHFATMKFVYDGGQPFLATFVYSRVIEAVLALLIFLPPRVLSRLFPRPTPLRSSRSFAGQAARSKVGVVNAGVFVANKVLAAGAFMLQNYAISLGSVTVVNALQGTQYIFLLLLAAAVSIWWPKLFQEELKRVAVGQKIVGIALISLGLIFLI